MKHILAIDSMSQRLWEVLETGTEYGPVLDAELDRLSRPGRCPAGEEGWNVDEDGSTSWSPGRAGGAA